MKEKERQNKFIPLRYPRAFNGFFGGEDHKDLLISMLHNYLDLEIGSKEDIEAIINTELEADKEEIPQESLRVRTSKGEPVNVEIQIG